MLSLLVESNFLSMIIRIPVKFLVVPVDYYFDFNPKKNGVMRPWILWNKRSNLFLGFRASSNDDSFEPQAVILGCVP